MDEKILHVGLDVGSTTVKIVIMDNNLIQYIQIIEDIFQTLKILFVMF